MNTYAQTIISALAGENGSKAEKDSARASASLAVQEVLQEGRKEVLAVAYELGAQAAKEERQARLHYFKILIRKEAEALAANAESQGQDASEYEWFLANTISWAAKAAKPDWKTKQARAYSLHLEVEKLVLKYRQAAAIAAAELQMRLLDAGKDVDVGFVDALMQSALKGEALSGADVRWSD